MIGSPHGQEETHQKEVKQEERPLGRKKTIRRKKPLQRMKARHSKGPSGGSFAQIHQGVGNPTEDAAVSTNGVVRSDLTPE